VDSRADTGVVTLIQRFGSAANLNIHLHCLVLEGVYLNCDGTAIFHEAAAPSTDELEAVLLKIITRTMRLLTRLGALIEEPERDLPRRNGDRWCAEISAKPPRAPTGLRSAHARGKKC
jgi:hypothetical protein